MRVFTSVILWSNDIIRAHHVEAMEGLLSVRLLESKKLKDNSM